MIGRIIGSGRGIEGMVAYITHDQTSPDNRRPTTSERVAWSACLGIPTTDTDLMVRAMQGLTADAPALKAMAGISARGRKLKKPYTHIVLSWPERTEAPPKQDMLSAVGGALKSLRLDDRHYAVCAAHTDTACPHVHVAVSRVDPETGRAVNLDSRATKRLSRWAEQYERDHGGIVVPTRVERRKAQAARRDLERRCRKGGLPREQARSTAARLHPRPPAKPARKRPPSPAGSTPEDRTQWKRLIERQAEQTRRQRTTEEERVVRRRREWRSYRAARSTGAVVPSRPRSASIRTLRADGARERIELRRSHRAERVSLARRLGRAAVAVWLRGTAAIRKLVRWPRRDIDREADRRRLDAELADARRRRTEQTREHLTKTVHDTKLRYKQAYAAWSVEDGGLVSWSSSPALDEKRRKVRAAFEASEAAYATYDRADKRLRRYERAVDAVERPRRAYRAPFSSSLEQAVAEADRRLAQERQPDNRRDHARPRADPPSPARVAETALARPPASPPASRQRRPPPKPPSRTERPRTGPVISVPDGVFPDNPETPPARADSTRTDAPAPTRQQGR